MPTVWPPCGYMLPPLKSELWPSRKATSSRRLTSGRTLRKYRMPYTPFFKTWFDNKRLTSQGVSKASNIMISRYVHKRKSMKNGKGEMKRAIRLRSVFRGTMDFEAFDAETFSATARRPSQKLLASTAACKKQWVIGPLDINM
eukprot:8745455-Pyramimonas_sp.AAC.1